MGANLTGVDAAPIFSFDHLSRNYVKCNCHECNYDCERKFDDQRKSIGFARRAPVRPHFSEKFDRVVELNFFCSFVLHPTQAEICSSKVKKKYFGDIRYYPGFNWRNKRNINF